MVNQALTLATPTQATTVPDPKTQVSVYAPRNFDEAMRLAELIAKSSLAPKDYRGRTADVFVAMMYGAELGLSPFQAVQDVKVINGRASIWGDSALALVQRHPDCIEVREPEVTDDEMIGRCIVYRRGAEPHEQQFSIQDAKTAQLWGKPGPWTQYPKRMLKLRARGFALRDTFAEALRGLITTEELQDYPAGDAPTAMPTVKAEFVSIPTPPTQAANGYDCSMAYRAAADIARATSFERVLEIGLKQKEAGCPKDLLDLLREAAAKRKAQLRGEPVAETAAPAEPDAPAEETIPFGFRARAEPAEAPSPGAYDEPIEPASAGE